MLRVLETILEAVSRLVQDCRFVAEFNGVGTSERKIMGWAGRGDDSWQLRRMGSCCKRVIDSWSEGRRRAMTSR